MVLATYPAHSYGEQLLELAIALGRTSGSSGARVLPTDPGTLASLSLAYADAVADFTRSRPWSWMTPLVTLTLSPDGTAAECVGGDATVYRLPWTTTGQPSEISTDDQWHSCQVSVVPAATIRRNIALNNDRSGPVAAVAIEDIADTNAPGGTVPVLRVYPKPDRAYELSFRLPRYVRVPTDYNVILPWGPEHDRTVRLMAEAIHYRRNANPSAEREAVAAAALNESKAIDDRQHPRRRGVMQFPDAASHRPVYSNRAELSESFTG